MAAVGYRFNDFRGQVKEVARPNRFLLSLHSAPTLGGLNASIAFDENMRYHVRSASLPPRSLGDITNLLWFGLNYKIVGDPTYDDYTVTFLNNVNWNAKHTIEKWMSGIINPVDNHRSSPNEYKAILKLEQLGPVNEKLATYYLHGVYPKSIDAVELSQESVDAVEDFSVNFSVDFWNDTDSAITGSGIADLTDNSAAIQ